MTSLIQNITLFIVALSLTACNLSLATPVKLDLKPTPTSTLPPTQTPVPEPTFTLPSPTADPVLFRDDFNGKLEPGWVWMSEVPEQWSLVAVPGSLQIETGRGFVNSQNITNVLLRPAPAGDFQMETKLTFEPEDNFQFAGLIIYQDESNFMQVGHAYCLSGVCIRQGLYMNDYQKGIIVSPNFGQPYRESNVVILRLIRKGTHYVFEMSADGRVFFNVGEHESDINPLQIGLVTGQNVDGEIIPAVFDYFSLASPR